MNRSNIELDALAPFVDALLSQPMADSHGQNAQSKLMQRLAQAKPRKAPASRWGWLTAAGVAGLLAVLVLPTLMIGPTPAFADVLKHFRDFTSLRMHMNMELKGGQNQHDVITVNREGDVRTDIERSVSVILNRKQAKVLTLLHEPRLAQITPFDVTRSTPEDSLKWIAEMREYQGAATLLSQTRTIDGQLARGYTFETKGETITMWAGTDGLPLEMDMGQGELMKVSFRFEFDRPTDADVFSTEVPAGYALAVDED